MIEDLLFVDRLISNERKAWIEFEHRFGRLIRLAIVRRLERAGFGDDEVEDVYQHFVLNLIERGYKILRDYDPEKGMKLSSYLVQAAKCRCRDYIRPVKYRRHPLQTGVPSDVKRQMKASLRQAQNIVTPFELIIHARRISRQLSPRVREVLLEGRTRTEVAERYELPTHEVNKEVRETLFRLRSA